MVQRDRDDSADHAAPTASRLSPYSASRLFSQTAYSSEVRCASVRIRQTPRQPEVIVDREHDVGVAGSTRAAWLGGFLADGGRWTHDPSERA